MIINKVFVVESKQLNFGRLIQPTKWTLKFNFTRVSWVGGKTEELYHYVDCIIKAHTCKWEKKVAKEVSLTHSLSFLVLAWGKLNQIEIPYTSFLWLCWMSSCKELNLIFHFKFVASFSLPKFPCRVVMKHQKLHKLITILNASQTFPNVTLRIIFFQTFFSFRKKENKNLQV